ncbi:hypothetical protein [Nocardia higoensis]|uniref:hypothetical protein n=1 Tax=Nocardia higoensis TaxID=228599 RepID=UPI001C3F2627|nr:hypothetical protein [Nocardia higoensis]
MAGLDNRRTAPVDQGGPIVTGLLGVGDSVLHTNPTFGMGIPFVLRTAAWVAARAPIDRPMPNSSSNTTSGSPTPSGCGSITRSQPTRPVRIGSDTPWVRAIPNPPVPNQRSGGRDPRRDPMVRAGRSAGDARPSPGAPPDGSA